MSSRPGDAETASRIRVPSQAATDEDSPRTTESRTVVAAVRRDEPHVLIQAKVTAPAVRDETVRRDRLLQRLDSAPAGSLTLVACPAGFGKSSLLASWYVIEAARRPTAWLTLDKADNDPVLLWHYLLESLRRVCPGIETALPLTAVAAPMITDVLLPRLVNVLAEQPETTLILDDFHELTDGQARKTLTWLVGHAPRNIRIVLSTRREPDLSLATMRARGQLIELRADDLRFTLGEADEFLNRIQQLGLASGDVAVLVERTTGWPAGLYLAALSLRPAADRHRLVARFSASNRHVVDYLEAEVLAAHEPADLELLVRCSVLDRLTGPVCDALLDRDQSGDALKRLARTNLFVVPLDDDSDGYRLHPLFAQLMRVELGRLDPGIVDDLRRRAYQWHREHGNTVDAIGYAIDAGLFTEASDLIAASGVRWINVGMHDTVLGWVRRLPHAVSGSDVRLQLVLGWAESISGRRRDAAATVCLIERLLATADDVPLPDGFSSGRASLATMQAIFSWGDLHLGFSQAQRAVELEGPTSPWRAVVCWAMGLNLMFRGEFSDAESWFVEATELAAAREQWLVESTGYAYRSLLAGQRGDHPAQARLADVALVTANGHGLEDAAAGPSIAAGASLAAAGATEEALPVLEHAVALARWGGQLGVLAVALGTQATVLCALGEHQEAKIAVREARSFVGAGWPSKLFRLCDDCRGADGTNLTERERTVLSLLDSDLSEADIARELFVSRDTVHSHTKAIYRKLGASTRAEAVAFSRATDSEHR